MMLYKNVEISKHELGLVFNRRGYARMIQPGKHRLVSFGSNKERLERLDLREPVFTHEDFDVMYRSEDFGNALRKLDVSSYERVLLWVDGSFHSVLTKGRYGLVNALRSVVPMTIDVGDVVWTHKRINEVIAGKYFEDEAEVVEVAEEERVVVWLDGRCIKVLTAGTYLVFSAAGKVVLERFSVENLRFEHKRLNEMLKNAPIANYFNTVTVSEGEIGLIFVNGALSEELEAGSYAFWKGSRDILVNRVSLKEETLDIAGQEIMSADKVTLRLNVLLTYVVTDAKRFVAVSKDTSHAIYREAQLALREAVGARELDTLLTEKDGMAKELASALTSVLEGFGVKLKSFGIRDIILPGEMKELLNKVIEAKKASEASLITRREETAAARMQANTAKILSSNPALLRLRELEVLEKVAEKSNLTVVVGEGGLTDRITKLL